MKSNTKLYRFGKTQVSNLRLSVLSGMLFFLVGLFGQAYASPNFYEGFGGPDVTNPNTNLTIVTNNQAADGTSTNSVQAHIADNTGASLSGQLVTFTISSGTASFAGGINTVTTDASGNAVVNLITTVSGNVSVTASVGGNNIIFGSPATVKFVAGPISYVAANTKIFVWKNNAIANGVMRDTLAARVVDANNNPVVGQLINFAIVSGSASFSGGSSAVSDLNGNAVIYITSTVVGQVSVTATVNAGFTIPNGSPTVATFVAGPPSLSASTLTIVNDNATADGSSTDNIQVHVVDATGNVIANQAVVFSITSGTASFVGSSTVTTDASGNATVSLNSTLAGKVNVNASINGSNITNASNPAKVTFVAGPISFTNPNTKIFVWKNNAYADGIMRDTIAVKLWDAFNNPVIGQTVVFSILSGSGTFVGSTTVITDLNGNAVIYMTSLVIGQVSITATANGTPVTNGSPTKANFILGPASPTVSTLSVVTNNAVADGVSTNSVQAHVTDGGGHIIANQAVVFSIASGTGTFVGSTTVLTDASGNASISLNSTVAGQVSINASLNGSNIVPGAPAVVTFVAGPASATAPTTVLTVVVNNSTADGSSTNSVMAHVTDAFGNLVANQAVVFAIASGTGTIVGSSTVNTDASGNAVINLTSTVPGQVGITATINGNGITHGSPALVTFVSGAASASASSLSVVANNAVADGISTNSVQAHITDALNNPLQNIPVVFAIASGTGTLVGTGTVTTDINGNAVITLTSTHAGQVGITASISGNNIPNGSPALVKFVAGPPSASASSLTVVANNATADGVSTNSVKAIITDANGNPVANQSVVFSIASGTGNLVGSTTVTTDLNGNASINITSTVVGQVGINASVGGINITTGSPALVSFVAGAPSASASSLTIVTNNSVADGVSTNSVQAHITDATGNAIVNQAVVFAISSGTGTLVGSGTVNTDANGNAVITLTSTVAGQVGITATIAGNNITTGSPATVTFISGGPNAATSTLSVVADNATADGVSTNSVQAHIIDAIGNPVPNQTVVFTIASGTGVLVGGGNATTDNNGNALITITSTVPGQVGITATVGGSNIPNGSPAVVTFVVGPPSAATSALTVITNNALPDGTSTNSVQAQITDANGNAIANQTVVFAIASGTGTLVGGGTVTTDVNGNAVITITSTVPGQVSITATVGGISITNGSPATVTFISVPDVTNSNTALTVLIPEAPADGQTTTSVKAHVVDQVGNPMAGVSVSFSIDSGTVVIITSQPVVTDANGDAVIEITSTTVGYALITAEIGTQAITFGSPARVKFVPINIYVPKVFTPNGDGVNDVLKPIVAGISSFHYFKVYNRWGNLIFASADPTAGWDGTFKGVMQPVETYLWMAEGVDTNGKAVIQKGMVSLVR